MSQLRIYMFMFTRRFFFYFRKYIPEELIPLVEEIGGDIEKYIPAPYAGEMKGIADTLCAKIGDVVIANILYDVTA